MVTRPHDFLRKETAHQGTRSQSQHVSIYYHYYYYYEKDAICQRRKQGRCILQGKIAEAGMFLSFVKGLEKPEFLAHHGI
jgi:hypothetical protein